MLANVFGAILQFKRQPLYLTPCVYTWQTLIQAGEEVFLMQKQSINSGIAQKAHIYFAVLLSLSFWP